MLHQSRLCFPRSAVAFFNMKHFQSRLKIPMTPQNAYETFSTALMPRDRLLRHSVSGRGAGRVLVLDYKQKVKGVYFPVCCLPHPATVPGGDGSLGVTVEDYLKVLAPLAKTAGSSSATTPLPTVLTIVSHPQGVAFGTFYADGRPALPLVNTDLGAASTSSLGRSADVSAAIQVGTAPHVSRSSTSLLPATEQLIALLEEHGDDIAQCSSFYWIMRDGNESLSLHMMRACAKDARNEEYLADGSAASSPIVADGTTHAISFTDKRWTGLLDNFFEGARGSLLYSRDPSTQLRIVDAEGLHSIMTTGNLLLDRVPQSMVSPQPDVKAADAAKSP